MISEVRRRYIKPMIEKYGRVIISALEQDPGEWGDRVGLDFLILGIRFDYPTGNGSDNVIIYWQCAYSSYTIVSYDKLDGVIRDLRLQELGI